MNKILGRYLQKYVQEDLDTRMVFIGGPRQVGKTTFAMQFCLGTQAYIRDI